MTAVAALELENVSRDYGGVHAVADVTLSVAERERRALIGPNGAGKTTLFRLISGEVPVSKGSIRLFGQDVTRLSAHRRVGHGLGRTYQITNVFPALSVEDNVALAALGLSGKKFQPLLPVPRRGPDRQRVEKALVDVGLADRARLPVRELSHGEQRQLELALALAGQPRVLLLDEPAAGLSRASSPTNRPPPCAATKRCKRSTLGWRALEAINPRRAKGARCARVVGRESRVGSLPWRSTHA